MNAMKKHWKSVIVGMSSIAFGFLAIFLGGKLYLTRNTSISPAAPQSMPGATFTNNCQGFSLTFTAPISTTTPDASPTESPLALVNITPSPSPTESPTPENTTTPAPTSSSIALASPTPAPIITSSPQPTNTPHTAFECNSMCSTDQECASIGANYICYNTGTDTRCRVTTNLISATCTKVSSLDSTSVPSPVSNQLPQAGISLPTTIILSFAAIFIIGSLLLI